MGNINFNDNESGDDRLRSVTRWIVEIVVVIVLAIFLVQSLGKQISVEGHSMEPALNVDDKVLVNQLSYHFFKINRLDVVLFESGEIESKIYMKRVIGLPGDTVQIKDGRIYINEELLDTGNLMSYYTVPGLAEAPIVLASNEYFLLGDNGDSSEDSRFAIVGNIKEEQIIGKIWFRVAPIKSFGFVR